MNDATATETTLEAIETIDAIDTIETPSRAIAPRAQIFASDMAREFVYFIDVSAATEATYKKGLARLFDFFRSRGISAPTAENLRDFKDTLKTEGRAPATISLYISATRRFFQWLEFKGLYRNIAEGLKGAGESKGHKRGYLTAEQIKDLLASIDRSTPKGKRDYALIALIASSGLRTIEVERADVADLRPYGAGVALWVQGKGKTDKGDAVKVHPHVERAIREYLATRDDTAQAGAPLFADTKPSGPKRRDRDGNPLKRDPHMKTRTISKIVKDRMRAIGLDRKDLSAHSLRHSAITLAIQGGQTMEQAQQFARHAKIETTRGYFHEYRLEQNTCTDTIGNAIFDTNGKAA